jgi:uncharacterized surface protein with fasciclin (FAS1) repeats
MVYLLSLLALLGSVSCQPQSIIDTARSVPTLSILVAILEDPKFADVATALSGDGPFTVLAPQDSAFEALIAALDISADPADWDDDLVAFVTQTLYFHVVDGSNTQEDLSTADYTFVETLETGTLVAIPLEDNGLQISNADVVQADVECTNGIVHIIDAVLVVESLMDLIASDEDLQTLAGAVSLFPDLVKTAAGLGEFTLFAPNNAAFEAMSEAVEELSSDQIERVLKNHIVLGVKDSADLTPRHRRKFVRSLDGGYLEVTEEGGSLFIDNAQVLEADRMATNGVAHIIDALLLPDLLNGGLQEFDECGEYIRSWRQCKEAAKLFGLEDTYPHYFHSSNRPVGCYYKPENIKEHDRLFFNSASHGTECSEIRQCLCAEVGPDPPTQTIAELAGASDQLSILYAIVTSGGVFAPLADLLSDPSQELTVFAPSDSAFEAFIGGAGISSNPADWDELTADLVLNTVTYHALSGEVRSNDLKKLQFPETLLTNPEYVSLGGAGQVLRVAKDKESGAVSVGPASSGEDAQVQVADVLAVNGVVHIIDDVLVPPGTIIETASAAGGFDTLLALLVAYDLASLDTTPGTTVFAPPDEAFETLLTALGVTADDVLNAEPGSELYQTVLTTLQYHVVPAVAYSTDLENNQVLPTLAEDATLRVDLNRRSGTVEIETGSAFNDENEAELVATDILTQTGVIHVPQNVLVPQDPSEVVDQAITSGTCSDRISSRADCNDAAESLDLHDLHASRVWNWHRPAGCYYDTSRERLYYNRQSHSDTQCSGRYKCLCDGHD